MKVQIEFDVDIEQYAKKIGFGNNSQIDEKSALMLEEDIIEQIKDNGFDDYRVYKKVADAVENYLQSLLPKGETLYDRE